MFQEIGERKRREHTPKKESAHPGVNGAGRALKRKSVLESFILTGFISFQRQGF